MELYVIQAVKEKRKAMHMTQAELSLAMGTTGSLVGNVETLNRRAKYHLNHINRLALLFGCSPRDFLPEKPIKNNEWPVKE
jgi:transcriptional regulator with XRE-family HTH domain